MDDPLTYLSSNLIQKKDVSGLLSERIGFLQWTPGERVLDIGCGPGDITAILLFPLLPEDATLVGCDISEEMINHCNHSIKNERMSFVVQDIENKISSNLQLESFDKIFSFYCLHWISDHRQAMRNIHSLLKPSGEILLMFITPDNPVLMAMNKLRDVEKWRKFIKERLWFRMYCDAPSFFHDILQDIGFENINCYLQRKRCHYPKLECCSDLLKSVNPYLKFIPEELKSEYMQEFIDIMKKDELIDKITREMVLKYNILVIVAKKPNKENSCYKCFI